MLPKQEILLSPIQQVRLELYREFGDKAQEAFDFIVGDETITAVATTNPATEEDGVYIIYEDGTHEAFNGENRKNGVKYVGVINGKRRIAVALHNIGGEAAEYQFLKDGAKSPEHSVYYTRQQGINAFEDFTGANNTAHIIKDYDSEIPFDKFEDGEYIASMGEWGLLMSYASLINEALKYVGGTPIKGWLWSSTENSQNGAWYVNFTDGYTNYYYGKYHGNSVRAVAAF